MHAYIRQRHLDTRPPFRLTSVLLYTYTFYNTCPVLLCYLYVYRELAEQTLFALC